MVPMALHRLPVLQKVIQGVSAAECRLFDVWHNVDTRMDDGKLAHDGVNFPYQPTRPGKMRWLLRALPISDCAGYTFVDFGSGKGRTLLVAGQFPFKSVQGIELQSDLHEQSVQNLKRRRLLRLRCPHIESIRLNATEYQFPATPLLLYFFNPFGPEVMQKVMNSLHASLQSDPRDVIVILVHPVCAAVVNSVPSLSLHREGPDHRIYRSRMP